MCVCVRWRAWKHDGHRAPARVVCVGVVGGFCGRVEGRGQVFPVFWARWQML